MKFKESKLAHQYLDGLKGIEIGGSAHNCFGLDTINVDRYGELNTIFKNKEFEICGEKMPVDVVAPGDRLPFPDKSFDFVISSHVIEHFFDPIAALNEWARVARKYIFIICPHKERTFDNSRPLTLYPKIFKRHQFAKENPGREYPDKHWNVWDLKTFLDLCKNEGFVIEKTQDPDDKVGNGFTVIIKL